MVYTIYLLFDQSKEGSLSALVDLKQEKLIDNPPPLFIVSSSWNSEAHEMGAQIQILQQEHIQKPSESFAFQNDCFTYGG